MPAGALEHGDPFEPARVVALAGRLADALRAVAGIVGPRLAGSKKARNAARIAAELPGLIELLAAGTSAAARRDPGGSRYRPAREPARAPPKVGQRASKNQAEEEALGAAGAELARTARTLHRAIKHVLALDEALLGAVRAVVAPLVEEVRQTLRRRGFETVRRTPARRARPARGPPRSRRARAGRDRPAAGRRVSGHRPAAVQDMRRLANAG